MAKQGDSFQFNEQQSKENTQPKTDLMSGNQQKISSLSEETSNSSSWREFMISSSNGVEPSGNSYSYWDEYYPGNCSI